LIEIRRRNKYQMAEKYEGAGSARHAAGMGHSSLQGSMRNVTFGTAAGREIFKSAGSARQAAGFGQQLAGKDEDAGSARSAAGMGQQLAGKDKDAISARRTAKMGHSSGQGRIKMQKKMRCTMEVL